MSRKINYKSDFDAILHLKSCKLPENVEIGWPDWDWTAKFYTTSREKAYVVSCINGVCTNCFNNNGQIHVVFNNHGLDSGTLKVEFYAEIPNGIYPDDSRLNVTPMPLDVDLVRVAAPCPSNVEMEVTLPIIKGDPMTWGSMSDEDRAAMLESFAEYAGMESCVALEEDEFEDVPQSGKNASDPAAWRKGCGIVPNTLAYGMMPLHPYPGVVYKMKRIYISLGYKDALQIKLRVGSKYNVVGGYVEIDIPEHIHALFEKCEYGVYQMVSGYGHLFDAQYDQQAHRLRIYGEVDKCVLCFSSSMSKRYLADTYRTGYVSVNANGTLVSVPKGDIYFRPKRGAYVFDDLDKMSGTSKYEVDVYRSFMHINKYNKSEKKVYRWSTEASSLKGNRYKKENLIALAKSRMIRMMRIRRSAKYEWSYLFSFCRHNKMIFEKLKTGPFLRRKA